MAEALQEFQSVSTRLERMFFMSQVSAADWDGVQLLWKKMEGVMKGNRDGFDLDARQLGYPPIDYEPKSKWS